MAAPAPIKQLIEDTLKESGCVSNEVTVSGEQDEASFDALLVNTHQRAARAPLNEVFWTTYQQLLRAHAKRWGMHGGRGEACMGGYSTVTECANTQGKQLAGSLRRQAADLGFHQA